MISINDLDVNCREIEEKITNFTAFNIKKAGLDGAIIAVSGGIDSATALACIVKAIGSEKITALHMLERDVTPSSDITDVMQHCEELRVTCNMVDITQILHVMRKTLPLFEPKDKIVFGNVKSRLIMTVSYHFANKQNKMVIGTSNKTELLTGFFTKYGDGGVDLMPLADLYKTQIRQLAHYLKIPKNIIKKPPSPGFFPGQTDEDELGVDYNTLDLILYSWDKGYTKDMIADEFKISQNCVQSIIDRVKTNEHKRRFPLILRLS